MITDIAVTSPPASTDQIEFIADLDELSEGNTCSCAAGDDNPF